MAQKNSIYDSIQKCIEGSVDRDCIFPFLWVHGESHERLQEEIEAIYNSGLREFCVESRTHDNFCEEQWWNDFTFILEYATSKNMKVWLLDDKHFPTGYANGAIEKKYPHLRRKCVRTICVDVSGPLAEACLIVPPLDSDEELISASAYLRTGKGEEVNGSTGMLLTDNIQNGLIYWSVPQGVWRVFFTIRTNRGPAHFKHYIDMCDAESCQVMLKEIYEPHYVRYQQYFGNTFRGFFSDEPCFANNIGSFKDSLGNPTLILPWRQDMISILAGKLNIDETEAELQLPALWFNITDKTASMRFQYMDVITKLYRDNFSRMLGDWCRSHNVMYIGHVIEDAGAHTRLGYGSGHFFRAMEGQDMAGMDIVLNQLSPGITNMKHTSSSSAGRAEPDFYHYTINHLATSAAHLDPKKQGRVMCELYGAFGWAEGLPTMRYFTDMMLVGGVNHFVPHAFSAKTEDPDCPPHFYNGGLNPQYPGFKKLMDYTGRMCNILRSGTCCADVAVYYNAESEWCGGEYIELPAIASTLGRAHIDFDFVPMDYLMEATEFNGEMKIHQCSYKVLLVPYGRILPEALCRQLNNLHDKGVKIMYIGSKPAKTEYGTTENLQGEVISIQNLAGLMTSRGLQMITLSTDTPHLRVLRLKNDTECAYFFFNPETSLMVDTQVCFEGNPTVIAYDGWKNKTYGVYASQGRYPLMLQPGCGILWCVKEYGDTLPQEEVREWKHFVSGPVKVMLIEGGSTIYEEELQSSNEFKNYARAFPRFGGVIRYEFDCKKDIKALRLGAAGEVSRLWIDGIDMGIEINIPHEFAISGLKKDVIHKVVIEVAVNQGYAYRDRFSANLLMSPMGIIGPLTVIE